MPDVNITTVFRPEYRRQELDEGPHAVDSCDGLRLQQIRALHGLGSQLVPAPYLSRTTLAHLHRADRVRFVAEDDGVFPDH